jgi:hypothetical protein
VLSFEGVAAAQNIQFVVDLILSAWRLELLWHTGFLIAYLALRGQYRLM